MVCSEVFVQRRQRNSRRDRSLGLHGNQAGHHREQQHPEDVRSKVNPSVLCVNVTDKRRPSRPVVANTGARAAPPLAVIPFRGTIPSLVVEDGRFAHIDEVCEASGKYTNDSNKYPTLSPIEESLDPPTEVLPASQLFHTKGISYAIVDPVGRCKLVVPYAIIVIEGGFRGCEIRTCTWTLSALDGLGRHQYQLTYLLLDWPQRQGPLLAFDQFDRWKHAY